MRSPSPILVAGRFREWEGHLLDLLRSLSPEDWRRPTVCSLWCVKDIASHLLDGNIRRPSIRRRPLVEAFRGLARRTVVISSADVYRAYGRFLGLEGESIEPTPLAEDAPLRSVLFPYRGQAEGPDDFFQRSAKRLVS